MTESIFSPAARALAAARRVAQNLALRRGRFGIAAIANTAPLLGALLTVRLIIGSFRGGEGEKTTAWLRLMWDLSESLWPFVLALGLGVFAAWLKHWVEARAVGMQVEIHRALGALDLILRNWRGAAIKSSE